MTYPEVDFEWSTNGAHPDARSYKWLKTWSGRRGSNPRRPAWEDDRKLQTKNIAFSACRSGDTVCPVFALCLRAALNGAQTEHTPDNFPEAHGPLQISELPARVTVI